MNMDSSIHKDGDHDMKMNKDMDHKMMDTATDVGDVQYMLRSVTCYTCHRGDSHPESKTPPHQEGPRPPAPDKPAN